MKVAIVAAMQEELAPFRQHFGAKQVVFEYRFSRDMNKIERAANETGCPIPVVFTDFSVDRITCFEQRGIPYDIVDESTISPIEEPMFISGTHKKILVYSLDDFQ